MSLTFVEGKFLFSVAAEMSFYYVSEFSALFSLFWLRMIISNWIMWRNLVNTSFYEVAR